MGTATMFLIAPSISEWDSCPSLLPSLFSLLLLLSFFFFFFFFCPLPFLLSFFPSSFLPFAPSLVISAIEEGFGRFFFSELFLLLLRFSFFFFFLLLSFFFFFFFFAGFVFCSKKWNQKCISNAKISVKSGLLLNFILWENFYLSVVFPYVWVF